MKGLLFLCALLANSEVLLEEGNRSADAGELDDAIATYHRLLSEDPEAAGAWLNLGNTAYRKGALGRAIAAFRMAQANAPRDLRIDQNLELVRAEAKDAVAPPSPSPALQGLFFWHYYLSPAELGWLIVTLSPTLWSIAFVL
ncbi:MAG: tetratricopeptide repeat protein, partial [Myxococcota bacterium]